MGGAAAAWVDDASALYYNPAGLTQRRFEAGFTTAVQEGNGVGDPSEQLEQFRRLFADPASAGQVDQGLSAMGGLVMNGSGLGVMAQGTAHVDGGQGSGRFVSAVGFGSGYRLKRKILGAEISTGTAIRLLYAESFHLAASQSGSPAASSLVGRGFTSDLGVRARWGDTLSLAVVLHDVAGTMAWRHRESDEPAGTDQWLLPLAGMRLGVAVTLPGQRGQMAAEWRGDGSWSVGAEQRVFFNALAVRVGHAEQGIRSVNTAGLGLRLGPFGLDASVAVPADSRASTLVAGLSLRL